MVPLQGEDRHAAETLAKSTASYSVIREKIDSGADSKCMPPEEALSRLQKGNRDLSLASAHTLIERGTQPCDGQPGLVRFCRDLALLQPSPYRLNGTQVDSFVRRIACPALVVVGDKGLKFQSERAKRQMELMAASAPHFEIHRVEGNHHVHMNQPEHVAKFLTPFLHSNLAREAPDGASLARHRAAAGLQDDDAPSRDDLMRMTRDGIPAKL